MSAFAIRNLSVLSYAQGFTHWHYKAAPLPLADVLVPGFFQPCADMLTAGDMIFVSAGDGGGQIYVHQHGKEGVKIELMCVTPTTLGLVR